MNRDSWISKGICFPLLFVGVLILGLMIPTFYEWSGADQSRPSPHTAAAFYAIVGFVIVALVALTWLPSMDVVRDQELEQPEENGKFQFNLRTLIITTSVIAIFVAGFTSLRLITTVGVITLTLSFSAWIVMRDLSFRWKLAALLGCMYFPYAWVLLPDRVGKFGIDHIFPGLGLPMFVPSILLGRFFGQRGEEHIWLLLLMTAIELAIGVWLIRLGPRRAVAWIFVVLLVQLSC